MAAAAAAALLPLQPLVPSGPYHARASALRSTSAKLGFSWVPPRDSNALTEEQAQANRAAAAAAAGIDGYLMPGEESTVGNSPIITEVWTFGVDQPGAREPPPSHTRDKQDQEASIFEMVKSVLPLSLIFGEQS